MKISWSEDLFCFTNENYNPLHRQGSISESINNRYYWTMSPGRCCCCSYAYFPPWLLQISTPKHMYIGVPYIHSDAQGEQIGRIFAHWVIIYFLHFFRITDTAIIFWLLWLCFNFDKETGWATLWAIFSQTRLVTLVTWQPQCQQSSNAQRLSLIVEPIIKNAIV
jgi:hypothetical protein